MTKEKKQLRFDDVEQLLGALAQEDAQTELMRGAARAEIRRVFVRRRCWRVAAQAAVLSMLGASLYLLNPETEPAVELAEAKPAPRHQVPAAAVAASPSLHKKQQAPAAGVISYESRENGCELVLYSVPL